MQALRLLAVDELDARIAYYRDATISAGQFVAQAEHVARALPRAAHVINLSENRYHFLLGWVAACLREQVTLLPSGRTDDVLARLRREYPDHHTIDDEPIERLALAGAHVGQHDHSGALAIAGGAHRGDRLHFRFDGRIHTASENLGQPVSQFAARRG